MENSDVALRLGEIEIKKFIIWNTVGLLAVALRTEGVDRNIVLSQLNRQGAGSPSVRRAWIEMRIAQRVEKHAAVALRTEGVDRNLPESG